MANKRAGRYLMVLDVGRTLRVWDHCSGSYGGWQAAVRTIDLPTPAERPGAWSRSLPPLRAIGERTARCGMTCGAGLRRLTMLHTRN